VPPCRFSARRRREETFERLVETSTLPGELVVDPFLGSGTTAKACITTGRRLIGADADPGAISLALRRLRAAEDNGESVRMGRDPADAEHKTIV
jgi:DNA modification methylase